VTSKNEAMMLSKSDFLIFLEAPMHLWGKYHGGFEDKPPAPFEVYLGEQGQTIETLAKIYLEDHILLGYEDAQLLWQHTFDDGRFQARADAIIFDRVRGTYDLYEIKSSTSVRPAHKYDLSFQALLLKSQLNLHHVFLVHIQKDYHLGNALSLKQFFIIADLTTKIKEYEHEVALLREEAYQLTQSQAPQPDLTCSNPKTCPCPALCHPNLPDHPIYDLPYIGKKAHTLRGMGITAIKDIPESFSLNEKQAKHRSAIQLDKAIIDQDEIRRVLSQCQYPINFLDYETFNPAIPLFEGYQPYEPIVFQYSLYVLNSPNETPQHFECLLTGAEDPATRIVPDLLSHIGVCGSVVVWNQSFEASRNRELAKRTPQYADQLHDINDRMFDLMKIFKDGYYVHPDFHGSASLKAILPVLCPELTYDSLAIADGGQAMLTWYALQSGAIPIEDRVDVEQALKTYCRMDTWGMVQLWLKLRQI
jgi:hypothetical protein